MSLLSIHCPFCDMIFEADNEEDVVICNCCGNVVNISEVKNDLNDFYIVDDKLMKYSGSKTQVIVPATVKVIGSNAFQYNDKIEIVDIPASVTEINDNAFAECIHLKNISIPKSVKKIGKKAFMGCKNLTNVNISSNLDILYDDTFKGCASLTMINLPNSLKTIGNRTFEGCFKLKNVAIPNSVTEINEGAFKNCIGLENISISENIKVIHNETFSECVDLKIITIPKSVTDISSKAFYNCKKLNSVIFSNNIVNIAHDAFYGCTNESLNIKNLSSQFRIERGEYGVSILKEPDIPKPEIIDKKSPKQIENYAILPKRSSMDELSVYNELIEKKSEYIKLAKKHKKDKSLEGLYYNLTQAYTNYGMSVLVNHFQASNALDAMREKKINPYAVGGLVNGAIGPVAGVAAGLDAAARNNEIDANRQKWKQRANQSTLERKGAQSNLKSLIDMIDRELANIPGSDIIRESYFTIKYETGEELYKRKMYDSARKYFSYVEGYKSASEYIKRIDAKKSNKKIKSIFITALIIATIFTIIATGVVYLASWEIGFTLFITLIAFPMSFVWGLIIAIISESKTRT